MAQSTATTMERVTQQAQSLAGQISDQANKAAATLRTGRAGRQSRGPIAALMTNARVPAATRFAWRAGQAAGRIQGASAVAPLAARGWRLALTHRLQAIAARTRLRAQARWLPLALAGAQMMGRTRQRLRQVRQVPLMPPLVTRGTSASGTRAAIKGPARPPTPRPQAAPRPGITPKQQAAARARAARARQRLWRAAWMFAIGLAIGGGWAYLYAQRRGPGYDAWRRRAGGAPQA
ncbi:MAG TPA: hypothetical protein VGR57_10145 [Ktedonobacterales bacterium]|nr:hypothetical protein [Ktedonobacterales bacterium]